MRHTVTGCHRCLVCHEPIKVEEQDYEATLMVSVLLADDAVFDCVLAMHVDCSAKVGGDGAELLVVTALGRAMVRAAEAGLSRSESQTQARSSPKTQRETPTH